MDLPGMPPSAKLNRAVCTFAEDGHTQLHDLARESLNDYCDSCGWDLCVGSPDNLREMAAEEPFSDPSRAASWYKVVLMYLLLEHYEEVLWLDADVFIWDTQAGLSIPSICPMAMVAHQTDKGLVPNCGVWLVRRSQREFLLGLWQMEKYRLHGWWEQSALIEQLGMGKEPLKCRSQANALFRSIYWLPGKWNMVPTHKNWLKEQPIFLHASGMSIEDRVAHMTRWSKGEL